MAFAVTWMLLRELATGGKQWIANHQASEATDRHSEFKGRLQQRLWLLPGSHEPASRQGASRNITAGKP